MVNLRFRLLFSTPLYGSHRLKARTATCDVADAVSRSAGYPNSVLARDEYQPARVVCLKRPAIGQRVAENATKMDYFARVAQLDRASDYESEGWGFESLLAHHFRHVLPNRIGARLLSVAMGVRVPHMTPFCTPSSVGSEQPPSKRTVGGSSPSVCTTLLHQRPVDERRRAPKASWYRCCAFLVSLAQLDQSRPVLRARLRVRVARGTPFYRGVTERLIVAVLKTAVSKGTVGSNPTSSATLRRDA